MIGPLEKSVTVSTLNELMKSVTAHFSECKLREEKEVPILASRNDSKSITTSNKLNGLLSI